MNTIKNEKLDKLYKQKKELQKRKLELEKEKLTLLLELKEITEGNGRAKLQQERPKTDYGLYLS